MADGDLLGSGQTGLCERTRRRCADEVARCLADGGTAGSFRNRGAAVRREDHAAYVRHRQEWNPAIHGRHRQHRHRRSRRHPEGGAVSQGSHAGRHSRRAGSASGDHALRMLDQVLTAMGIPANFPAHALGPVSCTDTPSELTATVTGMSRTSNSYTASIPSSGKATMRLPRMAFDTRKAAPPTAIKYADRCLAMDSTASGPRSALPTIASSPDLPSMVSVKRSMRLAVVGPAGPTTSVPTGSTGPT